MSTGDFAPPENPSWRNARLSIQSKP